MKKTLSLRPIMHIMRRYEKRHTLVGMEYDEAMRRALELAGQAAAAGDVPVGAVVLDAAGQIVGRGYNTREADGDPLAHAEIIAMHQAAQALGAWNLADCTLAVTLEPCPMCAGACIQTHIGTIAFGAWDPKLGACGSIWDIPRDPHIGHSPEVHGGVLEGECQSILTDFFAQRR